MYVVIIECILPGIIVDVHRRLATLFGEPHHVQHGHAQTLLLGFMVHWYLNPAIQKVVTPLVKEKKQDEKKKSNQMI